MKKTLRSLQENWRNARMGPIKDRKSKDLSEAERLRRGGKNTQKNYIRKFLIIWITMKMWSLTQNYTSWSVKHYYKKKKKTHKKPSRGDEIPAEQFNILKRDAVKVLNSICQQIWKS